MADYYEYFDVYERDTSAFDGYDSPKVAIFGHNEDVPAMIEVGKDLLRVFECTILVQKSFDEKDFGSTIPKSFSEISLFVVIVSKKFMDEDTYAGKFVVAYAKKTSRIIPIIIEDAEGLGRRFSKQYDKLHILRRTSDDYYDILSSYINNTIDLHHLIGLNYDQIKLREKIFKLKAFISYRKKDAELLHKALTYIYSIPEMLDMAVFYDSSLLPGERYDERLRKEISDSDVVIFVITPNILEEGNFVATKEYPQAVEEGKILLPIMMEETDLNAVRESFPAFRTVVDFHDVDNLTYTLIGIRKSYGEVVVKTAEEKFFLGYAYEKGDGTVKNIEVSETLYEEAVRENSGLAMLKVALTQYRNIESGILDAEIEESFRNTIKTLDDKLSQMDPDDPSAFSYANALSCAIQYSYNFASSDYDHDKVRELNLCFVKAVEYLRRIGIINKFATVPLIKFGEMYMGEGNLDLADYYYSLASEELFKYKDVGGNSIYSRLKEELLLSGQGHLMVLFLRRGDGNNRIIWAAKNVLERAIELSAVVFAKANREEHLHTILKDYYYIGACLERLGEEDASNDVLENLLRIMQRTSVGQEISSISDLHDIFYDNEMFRVDLCYSSISELKKKLDAITDWFVLDATLSELAEMFSFSGGFIGDARWNITYSNYTGAGYKCHKCNSRLYKVVFPDGNDPKLYLSPIKTKCITPARVFTCPKCAHFYAVPKGRKLVEGPVYSSLGYNADNQAGRIIYDRWLYYFDTIGDINARRKE